MQLVEIAERLGLKTINEPAADVEVVGGYASDLLSDVLGKAKKNALWVTNQKHQNVVGVAVMLDLAGVVIAGGIEPDANTLDKAAAENVALYSTEMSMFEAVGKLYELGARSC